MTRHDKRKALGQSTDVASNDGRVVLIGNVVTVVFAPFVRGHFFSIDVRRPWLAGFAYAAGVKVRWRKVQVVDVGVGTVVDVIVRLPGRIVMVFGIIFGKSAY